MNYIDKKCEEFRKQFDQLGLKAPKGSMKNLERELIVDYWLKVLKQALEEQRESIKSDIKNWHIERGFECDEILQIINEKMK